LTPSVLDHLARHIRQPSTLPPRSTARSTSTEPGFIDFTISRPRQAFGAGASRDQRGGDDDVLLGDVLGDQRRLLGLVLLADISLA
jgi:hypothetical protein